jgi:hypothetical protein
MDAQEFKRVVIEALRYRDVDIDADLQYANHGLYRLTEKWCQERAAQIACLFVGAMGERTENTFPGRAVTPLDAERTGAVPRVPQTEEEWNDGRIR